MVTVAVGGVRGDVWFSIGVVVTTANLVYQILANLGRAEAHWPAIEASTRAGKTAAVALHTFFVLCFVSAIFTN